MEEATWEEELIMKSKFSAFSLVDKTVLDGRGSDKENHREGKKKENISKPRQDQSICHVYSRRNKGGQVEEGKNDQLEKGITVWDGDKKDNSREEKAG